MKITAEATGEIQTINGTAARLWKGKTESGIDVRCWIAGIEVSKDADNTQFERELKEVRTERTLVSYDTRLFID